MAAIKGTNVAAPVVPFDTADGHPTHDARYGKGGYRTVATTNERDAIPAARREAGMLVRVAADGVVYQMGSDLTTWSTFTPAVAAHQHVAADVTDFAAAVVAAAPPTTNASLLTTGTLPDARLSGNIARTSDVSSAVSALVASAPAALDTLNELAAALGNDASFATTVTNSLAGKAPIASPTFTGTVGGISKAMVGLGNVDNTSDASKPISSATQAALDAKAAAVHPHVIADVTGLQTALDGKQASGSYAAASHSHGSITADGSIGTTSGLPVITTTSGVLTTGAFGTSSGQFAAGDHTHAQLHDRSHAMTGTSDHTASNWRVFHSNGSGQVVELALGASGTVLTSAGASAAPTFSALPAGGTKTIQRFDALDNQPPSTAFATLDTRNSIAVLDFDDATKESAVFVGVISESAALGSGLIVRIHWMATTATTNACRWEVSLERSNTDLDSDSFDTVATAATTTNGTSGIPSVTDITLTTIDSVAAGDLFRLRVARDAANAADTMTGDAELIAVEVRSAA